jgi:hypothetical protein
MIRNMERPGIKAAFEFCANLGFGLGTKNPKEWLGFVSHPSRTPTSWDGIHLKNAFQELNGDYGFDYVGSIMKEWPLNKGWQPLKLSSKKKSKRKNKA